MKTLASIAFGTAALAAASIGLAEPASARTNVGVYISPYGIGVSLNPNYCSDYRYRRNHWDYCARYYDYYDNAYSPYFDGYYSGYRVRHYDNRGHNNNHWRGDNHRGDNHRGDNHRGGDHRHH